MSIKVYLHLELEGYPEHTSKIQIPKSWLSKEVKDIVGLFLPAYVKKNPECALTVQGVHLALNDGTKIFSNSKVEEVLEDHVDYYIKLGAHEKKETVIDTTATNQLRCRNFGCNQYFSEESNSDEACWHHVAPPIFHDTMKCWSCCKDKKAYDFESFQLITGCTLGRHSAEPRQATIAPSPNAVSGTVTNDFAPPALKSISDFNSSNPEAVSAAASAVQTLATRKSTRNADGTARCQRKGCQKMFVVAENEGECCTFHKGQPIFHDAAKFWSCCPQTKCYDFDEFLAVKGCTSGRHDDGEIDLE